MVDIVDSLAVVVENKTELVHRIDLVRTVVFVHRTGVVFGLRTVLELRYLHHERLSAEPGWFLLRLAAADE